MPQETSPAFQFYVKEWRSSRSVMRMTFAQRGMYLEMLLEQWESLTLPDSAVECADLIGGTPDEWTANWPALRRKFVDVGAGRIRNERLELARKEKRKYIKRAEKGGKARAAEAQRSGGRFTHQHDDQRGHQPSPASDPASPPATLAGGKHQLPTSTSTASATASASPEKREIARAPGGPIIGRNPHIDHAACGPELTWCVPSAVHRKLAESLAPQHHGDRDAAKDALQAWYPTVWKTLPPDFVMPEAFRFWQGRFDAAFASVDQVPGAKKSEPRSNVPDVEATRRRYL